MRCLSGSRARRGFQRATSMASAWRSPVSACTASASGMTFNLRPSGSASQRDASVTAAGDSSAACEAGSAVCAGGRGTGEAGSGRASDAAPAVEPVLSEAALDERGTFCPTTYPIAKATANSSTTMKKPLSNCRLPTTSSNSPVS